jgi:peptide/nickel transport system substrate-binding protein
VTAQDYQIVRNQSAIWPNLLHIDYMYNDPVVRELFRTKEFRIALSIAIDREKQNELVFAGQGVASQFTVPPAMPYYKEEYMYMHSEYDPEAAMQLLDELGVTDQDGDGWRENADGEDIFFTIDYLSGNQDRVDMAELTMEDWKAIGLNVAIQSYDASLFWPTRGDGQQAIHMWAGDRNGPVLFVGGQAKFVPSYLVGNTAENAWSQYYQTGEGPDVPPAEALEAYESFVTFATATSTAQQDQAADTILRLQAEEVWNIGTVGLVAGFTAYHNDVGGVWTEEADGIPVTTGWDFWTVKPWNGEHHYFKTRPLLSYEDSLLKNWYPMDQWANPLGLSSQENWF